MKESTGVDTSIISEVSEGKNGIKIKRADQMKALQWLTEHMDMAAQGTESKAGTAQTTERKTVGRYSRNDEAVEKWTIFLRF